jgi:hypothetical protein
MPASSSRKTRLMPSIASVGFFILIVPVTAAIVASLSLTATAAYENVKFVRTTEQILSLIAVAEDNAAKDSSFGQGAAEDIVDDLVHRGQLTPQPVNAWGGSLRAVVQQPPFLRIETDLSSRACRRVALFFGKDAADLKILRMEVRGESGFWRAFYNAATSTQAVDYTQAGAACGDDENTTLSLTLRLR